MAIALAEKYKLQIPNPCREDWHAMRPDHTGRYCLHCNKSVIDFTQLTDEQITRLLEDSKGKLCGRLNVGQLNRALRTGAPSRLSKLKEIFAALLLLVTTEHLDGAKALSLNKATVLLPTSPGKIAEQKTVDDDTLIIYKYKGRVVDSATLGPLIATVENKTRLTGSMSDDSGRFEILVYPGDVISVNSLGYLPKQIIITGNKVTKVIKLQEEYLSFSDLQMVGAISVRHPIWHRIRYFFRHLFKHKRKE